MIARPCSPSSAAVSTSVSGWEAPSRNENVECACSSAYGTAASARSRAARSDAGSSPAATYGPRCWLQAGESPPSPAGGRPPSLPGRARSDSRRSSSDHFTGGLL
ncbi:hypothetical protein [Kribbella sp. ALI-6-A]|uniref:hypothetical protein n=1 Tax=Kribbella sp. ALI-6-A TaxID=1933817 RepID=UPI001EDC71C4|nr:hypothetical protein [Kribbella sp. ALI-6-A]